ncbi:ornithine cyclodeaminase family protein [Erysipelothrix sp. HDW6A]|uniref:ornithine cyclodeaminase family protein n=1 Tax=Erysipelothrix sp. HDW6A TaxID=2714928 RepID=UPI00140C449B|nr:ornithine cyclodeaminase family protein [Erysipelothrix sp. HDW6A]QIK56989.1 ornithine cyclodeaminase family protein [Erysipelothrix sp. HDW6A]
MIYITEDQVKEVVNMQMALDVFRQAYLDNVKGLIYTGDRIVMPIIDVENSGQWLTAISESKPYFGSKFSSVFPSNLEIGLPSVISTISLYSNKTGELEALLEANYLTAIKTGGSAGVATDIMARKDANKLGIIGSGLQAFTQVLAIQEVRDLEELYVYDIKPEFVDGFIERIKKVQNRPYKIIAAKSADECVSSSDIICTCTTSHKPVFSASAVKAGTHVNAIGSFTPYMQEIEDELVVKSSRIITEHVDGLWAAAGDIIIPLEKGLITKDKVVGSVGDVLAGTVKARHNDEEITLYESVGSCVLDVAIAIATFEELNK